MIIGQATLAIELIEQMTQIEKLDAVILPTTIDGCGLTVGLALAIKHSYPAIKVIVSEQILSYNCYYANSFTFRSNEPRNLFENNCLYFK